MVILLETHEIMEQIACCINATQIPLVSEVL
jgi:hypothetical protein